MRARAPRPGAYAITAGNRIQLLEGVVDHHPGIPPGEVRAEDGVVLLGTGDGAIQLAVVQPEGRSPMAASAWLRGVRRSPVVLEAPPGPILPPKEPSDANSGSYTQTVIKIAPSILAADFSRLEKPWPKWSRWWTCSTST